MFRYLCFVLLFASNFANARSSDLPILFSCNQPQIGECDEQYFNFEPSVTPMCGIGVAVRDVECPKGPDFLGACRSAAQGGGGYLVQVVQFFYPGMVHRDAQSVERVCRMAHGEYLPN